MSAGGQRIFFLGIGGTLMGGLALLAREMGHQVSGSDGPLYPPMSDQLADAGITVHEGFEPEQMQPRPDLVVIGNAQLPRGHPAVEYVLDENLPYISGAEWLGQEVLRRRWPVAASGTHGKTTTASMVAHILECAGHKPGFLIGGVPLDFGVSSRLGDSPFFVVEAGRIRHLLFRPSCQVRPLSASDAHRQQHRTGPRRHLRRRRADQGTVSPSGANRPEQRADRGAATRPPRQRDAGNGRMDAHIPLRRGQGRSLETPAHGQRRVAAGPRRRRRQLLFRDARRRGARRGQLAAARTPQRSQRPRRDRRSATRGRSTAGCHRRARPRSKASSDGSKWSPPVAV